MALEFLVTSASGFVLVGVGLAFALRREGRSGPLNIPHQDDD